MRDLQFFDVFYLPDPRKDNTMPVAPRTPEAERQINEARKMPGYPEIKDHDDYGGKDNDQLTGDAREKPEGHTGAPNKLPGYSKGRPLE